jgi:hypothetical protein
MVKMHRVTCNGRHAKKLKRKIAPNAGIVDDERIRDL